MLTKERVAEALRKNAGVQAAAARALGVTRQAIQNWLRDHPELREVIAENDETLLDLAESNLIKALKNGEKWATRYMLDTKGKVRGYTRRVEFQPTAPLQVTFSDADYAMG